ncbi:MAG: N-acetylglucosaminyl-diphospho-decaprenol L-rhamnosyltransferase [Parcubacteria group bacterium ADurb.Bin159]|jgi:hypothetical protein|nr:MAG: N-acetylglucosaminyl-diphospho-decaprenol L-rhamnosyltransferase [Parcubacteria group bacterium ADurb.Bin159]
MLLSIIIVHFNQSENLRQCLDSIKKANLNFSFEIIIIDNSSNLGTVFANAFPLSRINKAFSNEISKFEEIPSIRIISNKKNVGFAKAVNQGIKTAKGEYILILNPDVSVEQNSIQALISFLNNNPKVGLVGPALYYPNGKLQYSARRFPSPLVLIIHRTFFKKTKWGQKKLNYYYYGDKDLTCPFPVSWILGAALMVRASALKDTGLMNEKFFLYFEDIDWAHHFWQNNWEVYYFPQAKVVHSYQRLSDKGGLLRSVFSPIFWIHLSSAIKYFLIYGIKPR